ncbi:MULTISPECIES: hypothetical protein [unclassified Mesorhizobium]|uniref:hypothetical protein n=1 Tax=unclassified Mesorhizobium TaxID=325217 RepID=UPI0015C77568|nr:MULTISPECIES: hypothetical protein [unclassified Mesorhizobium]
MRHPASIMAKPEFALAIGAVLAISTALAGDAAAHHRLFARWLYFAFEQYGQRLPANRR